MDRHAWQPDPTTLWRAAGQGFGRLFRHAEGSECRRSGAGSLAVSGASVADLNCGVVDARDGAAAAVADMAAHLRRRDRPGLVLVADGAGPEADDAARGTGLTCVGRMPMMCRAAGTVAAAGLGFSVRRVADRADLAVANRIIAEAFELPVGEVEKAFAPGILDATDVRVEIVLDGDEAVGALQTTVADGMAGVWSMATRPAHRRRGVARSGLTHALGARFGEGCEGAFLIATDSGRPLYEAAGFAVAAWCSVWVAGHDPAGA